MPIPLIIFSKAPIAGKAKTRMIPALGAEGAAALHGRLLEHCIQQAIASDCSPIYLYTALDPQHPFIQQMLARYPLIHRQQHGQDLGERMHNAFVEIDQPALLMGSDCPALSTVRLSSYAQLLQHQPALFTPAEDGGYTLVGLQKANAAVFQQVEWGSGKVMVQTRDQLRKLALPWHETETLWDVDRPEDLVRAQQQFPALNP